MVCFSKKSFNANWSERSTLMIRSSANGEICCSISNSKRLLINVNYLLLTCRHCVSQQSLAQREADSTAWLVSDLHSRSLSQYSTSTRGLLVPVWTPPLFWPSSQLVLQSYDLAQGLFTSWSSVGRETIESGQLNHLQMVRSFGTCTSAEESSRQLEHWYTSTRRPSLSSCLWSAQCNSCFCCRWPRFTPTCDHRLPCSDKPAHDSTFQQSFWKRAPHCSGSRCSLAVWLQLHPWFSTANPCRKTRSSAPLSLPAWLGSSHILTWTKWYLRKLVEDDFLGIRKVVTLIEVAAEHILASAITAAADVKLELAVVS